MSYAQCFDELDLWRDELRRSQPRPAVIRSIEERITRESDLQLVQILRQLLAEEHRAQGDLAAETAVWRADPEQEIIRWHDDWREKHPGVDEIPAIEERIRHESHPQGLHALRCILAREHWKRGDYAASERVYLADFEANSDRPEPLIWLARQKLDDENQPEVALRIIDRAVPAALRSGIFRRQALGVKARIALALESYAMVEDVLRQIMGLTFTRGNLDKSIERDFLDALPPEIRNAEVARAYDEYCRAHGKVSTASHGQIDELILSLAGARWQKVAKIIGKAFDEFEARQVFADEDVIGARVRAMVEQGKLDARGDISQWRRSEVKLID